MAKQNLELTKEECRANAVRKFREIMYQNQANHSRMTDREVWAMFCEMERARDDAACEGGYFHREI